MTDNQTSPDVRSDAALDAIRDALADPNVSIRLPHTFTHGRGVQIYVKSRKVGPVILRSENQTLADILRVVGNLAEEALA